MVESQGNKKSKISIKDILYYAPLCIGCVGVLTGVVLLVLSLYCSSTSSNNSSNVDALKSLKNAYISAVEAEVQITTIPEKRNSLIVSLIDDGTKFWVVDKKEFSTEKEDFAKTYIVLDKDMTNIIRGEQYKLDGKYYNLIDKTVNTDNLTELSYNDYKTLENEYTSSYKDVQKAYHFKMQGAICLSLGVFLLVIKPVSYYLFTKK